MQIPRQPQPVYAVPGQWPGLVQHGNLDLYSRPRVQNPDGSISTVRSVTFTTDSGKALLLPTVIGDRVVTPQQALSHYNATGQHLGVFRTNAAAERYAEALHLQQAALYGDLHPHG